VCNTAHYNATLEVKVKVIIGSGNSRRVFEARTGVDLKGIPGARQQELNVQREQDTEDLKNFLFRPKLLA